MRTLQYFLLCLTLCLAGVACKDEKETKETRISISGAFALYPLAEKWTAAYHELHPDIHFDVQAGGAGKGLSDVLSGTSDIGMFSREITDDDRAKGIWWIGLCKEAVLPTINAANPYREMLHKNGLKKEAFKEIFIGKEPVSWGSLWHGITAGGKINRYTREDAAGAAESWAAWFGQKQADLQGTAVFGDTSMAAAVKKDTNAIGYNNSLYVFDNYTGEIYPGLDVIPIDINGNGKIDADEDIYKDLATFLEAVQAGKFPSPPARDLYFITKGRTQKPEVAAFFKWVLTDGQKLVHANGYVPLKTAELQQFVKKVNPDVSYGY